MGEEKILQLSKITKSFGNLLALDRVDLSVLKGAIHGLLGENGAGKTTLMNVIYGLYHPNGGEILFKNNKVKINSPQDSIKLGIGMVHQFSTLVPGLTVLENLILGTPGQKLVLPYAREKKKIENIAEEIGFQFPLEVKIRELPVGLKQKIEIARALYREAKVLILDEPTTSFVESEFQQLLKALKILVEKEVTVLFITHKIREVLEACTSVTVLRKGRLQGVVGREEMTTEKLVKLMFIERNIEVTESALPKVRMLPSQRSVNPVVVARSVSTRQSGKNTGLKNVSFSIHGGEILGVAAVAGNGEKELAEVILNPSKLTSGEIYINNQSIKNLNTLDIFARKVFYTPEDRVREGTLPEGNIAENVLLGHHNEERFYKRRFFIDWNEVRSVTRRIISNFNIDIQNEESAIRRLSGGNIQKVIIGRALINPLELLIAHNPTSGLDISTVEFIFKKFIEMRDAGGAVLWINEDLDELMIISDRIAVLHNGELKGSFDRDKFDKYNIGLLMIGA